MSAAFVPALRLGSVILRELALDSGLRELAILQVGRLAARYEWDQHVPIAREAGISAEQIDTALHLLDEVLVGSRRETALAV